MSEDIKEIKDIIKKRKKQLLALIIYKSYDEIEVLLNKGSTPTEIIDNIERYKLNLLDYFDLKRNDIIKE